MSKYTTGEVAKLCNVSVRTVQYYDSRKLLVPSELSEGGRRLYTEEDLKRMKIICFLRDMDIPINTIIKLFEEEQSENVIELCLKQQEEALSAEIKERQETLEKLEQLKKGLKNVENVSLESIGDIAYLIESKKKMRILHGILLGVGIPLEILEWVTFFWGIKTGIWWPYLLGLGIILIGSIWLCVFYYRKVEYICPKCHMTFIPKLGEMVFARHTPTTRKLTCTHCENNGFCVEVYRKEKE